MKKNLFLIFLLIPAVVFSQQKLTLQDAIKVALQRNSNLIISKNNLEGSKSNLKSAYGNLLPSLGVSGSFNWSKVKDDGGSQLDEFGVVTELPVSEYDTRSYGLSVSGNWVLFDGLSNLATISGSKDDLEAAKLSLERQKEEIIYQTIELYYSVLNYEKLVKVREDNIQFNKKFLEQVQERNRLGSVAIADVYTQQVQLGNAELSLITEQNNLEDAKSNLLNFLALDVLKDYEYVNPADDNTEINISTFDNQFASVEAMVSAALANRKDYKSQMLSVSSAKSGITAARGSIFPKLTSSFGYGTSATDYSNLFNRQTYNFGLSLSVPIFSNFNVDNAIQLAKVSALNEGESLSSLERKIKIEVKQDFLDFEAAKKGLDVATKNLISAEENRRINFERYNLGAGTILDVLQSDRDLTQAQSDKINATFEFYRTKDKLLNTLGKLESKQYE
ncbi:MAG: TolC family protein [Ignavibacteria bacterium]|jgi:outer membrane protein